MSMKIALLSIVLSCALLSAAEEEGPVVPEPTDAARKAAQEIRREALLPPNGPEGRPLPLASHWNVGTVRGTFEPAHQIGLMQQGSHVLPWMTWPQGKPEDARFQAYWVPLIGYCRALNLPISFRGTQWNSMLVKKSYREGPEEAWAGTIAPDGKRVPKVSPFGAVEPWKDPAKGYVDTVAMKWVQQAYPDPPLVLWVSNNEPPELRWAKHGPLEKQSKRYLEQYGEGKSNEFKRKVFSEGWLKRYGVMFDAMRAALVSETWRKNVRFVGYGAFGPSHFGRWNGWKVYSLITDEWTAPDWYFWDGGSPSYYTHNWNDNRDHWVFSTQVQSMNWVFMLEEAWKVNPNFWFEISTWDGNEIKCWLKGQEFEDPKDIPDELLKKSKALQYLKDGQDFPPERTLGWVQFGMWLLRPRVVREFRGHATPLEPIKEHWLQTVKAVDRVYANETLTRFWRHGELVPNAAHAHPYQTDVPEKYKDVPRWFLLDTSLDAPRPWTYKTDIPVFSMALVLGKAPEREWLVYAHSPLADREGVEITVPGFGKKVTVDVPRGGVFCVAQEEKEGRFEVLEVTP